MHRVRFVHRPGVDVHHAVANLQPVAANGSHSLQEGLFRVPRIAKHDNVAAVDGLDSRQAPVSEWNFRTVKKLVQKKVVANQDGPLHGSGRDHRDLDHENLQGQQKQSQDKQSEGEPVPQRPWLSFPRLAFPWLAFPMKGSFRWRLYGLSGSSVWVQERTVCWRRRLSDLAGG